ncbi:MAG TPA: heavy metal-binding domain-containing protein [Thermoanaerobaculia bacterium]
MDRSKISLAASWAAGLVLAALAGCGGEETVASKSAAAFEEAQERGETFGGDGHAHGHGAAAPEGGEGAPAEDPHAGHAHGGAPAAAGEAAGHGGHGGHSGMDQGRRSAPSGHEGHTATAPGGRTAPGGHEDHGAMDHSGHQAAPSGPAPGRREDPGHTGQHAGHGMSPQAPASGTQPPGPGHAGHSPSAGAMPSVASAPAPVAVPSEQPARTLRPDALDAPAATSVLDAQRSVEMAREMGGGHGGHGGHGSSDYHHVDAGRGPGAYTSEPQPPAAGPQGHDHGSAETLYVCPMHPEVTSETPGTCPKCGMALVERRKG